MSDELNQLLTKISSRTVYVSVIGLGYVGLPLAVVFAEAGHRVAGIDVDDGTGDAIKRGESYIEDIPSERIRALVREGLLDATTDYSVLSSCDTVSICVPTPLNKTGAPEVSYII